MAILGLIITKRIVERMEIDYIYAEHKKAGKDSCLFKVNSNKLPAKPWADIDGLLTTLSYENISN